MKELRIENEKFSNEIKKKLETHDGIVRPMLENYQKNQLTLKSINQYVAIITKLSGFITASIIVYGAIRYVFTL